jgi:hypothetical protein
MGYQIGLIENVKKLDNRVDKSMFHVKQNQHQCHETHPHYDAQYLRRSFAPFPA